MSAFVDAVADALHTLDRRGYADDKVIIYTHPVTLADTKSEMDYMQPFEQGAEVFGRTIEATENVPEGVVLVSHLDAAVLGEDAFTFARVED